MTATIRSYEPRDRAAVYDVCVRTAASGGDARGQYSTDDLMPDIFAGPYVDLEPELAFVLDEGARAVGSVVATADTARFVQRYRDEWIPALGTKYAVPPDPPASQEHSMLALHFWPERMLVGQLAAFPAHLHIDLLPEWQGKGHGRALMARLFMALAEAGVAGVHLGMVPANVAARAFYDRLGFVEVEVPSAVDVTYLARSWP